MNPHTSLFSSSLKDISDNALLFSSVQCCVFCYLHEVVVVFFFFLEYNSIPCLIAHYPGNSFIDVLKFKLLDFWINFLICTKIKHLYRNVLQEGEEEVDEEEHPS